jgi:hypothetical protein
MCCHSANVPPRFIVVIDDLPPWFLHAILYITKERWSYNAGDFIKRSSSHSKFSMSGQEKSDILMQVSA